MYKDSVRSFTRQAFNCFSGPVHLRNVTVNPPTMEKVATTRCFQELMRRVLHSVSSSQLDQKGLESHWLQIVPEELSHREEDIVNYLGMVAAIDFRHWGEKQKVEPGEVVETLTPFYCVASSSTVSIADKHHAEHSDGANRSSERVLIRGSAAMMYLLRRAVEIHHIPWYDPSYLTSLGSHSAVIEKLKICFTGCESNGETTMMMPGYDQRVEVLVSLASALMEYKTSFFDILVESDGYLFANNASRQSVGFVNRLLGLHWRYEDFGKVYDVETGEMRMMPILKLAQLTAIGISDALRSFWCRRSEKTSFMKRVSDRNWLTDRAEEVFQEKTSAVFNDEDELSLCCDYQIPKALQACDLLTYNSYLQDLIDHNVLLPVEGEEESSIRVATLVCGEMLLQFINENIKELSEMFSYRLPDRAVTNNQLDYALWFMGRTLTSNHHLCRTIMY